MNKVLDYQVGGDHYKGFEIEPAELFAKLRLDAFTANAVKYIARWRKKNGVEDLHKAEHYLTMRRAVQEEDYKLIQKFVDQFQEPERTILLSILQGENPIQLIQDLYYGGKKQ